VGMTYPLRAIGKSGSSTRARLTAIPARSRSAATTPSRVECGRLPVLIHTHARANERRARLGHPIRAEARLASVSDKSKIALRFAWSAARQFRSATHCAGALGPRLRPSAAFIGFATPSDIAAAEGCAPLRG
jgi:hypothetical protein